MSCPKKDIVIRQGKTFTSVLRWETQPIVYKAITAITQSAPVSITATAHGVPDGWRVAVVSVRGMTQINAECSPPSADDYVPATVIDPNTIQLNSVNSSEYRPYTSGGYIQYNTPHTLTGYTARMVIKDRIGGTDLLELTSAAGDIELDTTEFTITATISAEDTAAITWTSAVYELELTSGDGVVSSLLYGDISVVQEIAT